jgi:hypothetical protein
MTELTKLNFTSPITRYESTAIYENSKGQKFLIRVCGCDKHEVETRSKNLLVFLEFSTIDSQESPQNINSVDDGTTNEISDMKVFEFLGDKAKQDVTNALEISVELPEIHKNDKIHNIKFAFADDMPEVILPDGNPRPVFQTNTSTNYILGPLNQVQALITVRSRKATFSLWKAREKNTPEKDWIFVDEVFVEVKPNSSKEIVKTLPDKSPHIGIDGYKYFKLIVDGETGTDYSVKGNWDIA